jgi:hypothetical protein
MSRYAAVCRRCGSAEDFADPDCPYSCVVGWDARRDTYFCQVEDLFMQVPPDEDETQRVVFWVGQWWQEITSVPELETTIAAWATITPQDREALARDRAEQWYRIVDSDIYVQLADDEVSADPAEVEQGIRWARHYSAAAPEGEYGRVYDSELKPVSSEEVERVKATWPEPRVVVQPLRPVPSASTAAPPDSWRSSSTGSSQSSRRRWLGPA